MEQQYDLLYLQYKRKKRISFFLQVLFLAIGALLIGSFAILFKSEPKEVDALLSPIISSNEEKKSDSQFSLLFANNSEFIYKETKEEEQTISLVNRSTNLTQEIINGKRVGFGGFISDTEFYIFEDNEGFGKFTVYTYDTKEKIKTPFIAFWGPKDIGANELDNLIAVAPDKTKVVITHATGIVIYTPQTTKETTILDNSSEDECTKPDQQCIYYRKPKWVSNNSLLVYQSAIGTQTPMLVNTQGAIQAVFPANLTNLAPSAKGLPLIGVSSEGLHIVEPKKTTITLESTKSTEYLEPVWIDNETIAVLGNISGLPTVLKTDTSGKKVVSLKEFLTQTKVSNLLVDPNSGGIYFLAVTKSNQAVNTQFFKLEKTDEKPVSFYTINKNL